MQIIADNAGFIAQGLLVTIGLTVFGFVGAMVLGTVIAICRVSPIVPLRGFGTVYVEFFRNIPLLSLLILVIGLRAALSLEPDRVEALRTLADLCFQDEDWRGATEALIRIARLTKDRNELRDVFYKLGDIYDEHLPDPKRADAYFIKGSVLLGDSKVDAKGNMVAPPGTVAALRKYLELAPNGGHAAAVGRRSRYI